MKATHTAGASLSVAKTSNQDEYLIRLYFYRDCTGISLQPVLYVVVSNSSATDSIPLVMVSSNPVDTSNSCPSNTFNCLTGYGVEEYIYEGFALLPPSSDWLVSFSECCRNPATGGMPSPWAYNIYAECTLDNLSFPNNSTPEFNTTPSLLECFQLQATHVNTVYEPDGDSIVYTIIEARNAHADTIPYDTLNGNYDAFGFFPTSPSVILNSSTGVVSFIPGAPFGAVLVVKASEYRNGTESGSAMRDIFIGFTVGQVGIDENYNQQISIHPNPATDFISIELPENSKASDINIYNTEGALVKSFTTKESMQIDISNFEKGIYFIQNRNDDNVLTSKLIKL